MSYSETLNRMCHRVEHARLAREGNSRGIFLFGATSGGGCITPRPYVI